MFLQQIRLENALRPDFFKDTGRILTLSEIEGLRDQAMGAGIDCRIR
jgi:hypothetical protein